MFSQSERLSFLFQLTILEKLEPDGSWGELAEIMRSGYVAEYGRVKNFLREEISQDKCEYVSDVLAMYDALQYPYVNGALKSSEMPDEFLFPGFDGSGEDHSRRYALFLRKDGRWSDLRLAGHTDLKSHWPTRDMYLRMLAKWSSLGQPHILDGQDAQDVAAESIHPENRR